MITLRQNRKPRWIDFSRGVRMHLKPVNSTMFFVAEAIGYERAVEIGIAQGLISDVGGRIEDLPQDEKHMATALAQLILTQELAIHSVDQWEGIGDEAGGPAALTPENMRALISEDPEIARTLRGALLGAVSAESAEGNASGAGPSGISDMAPAPNIATDAEPQNSPVVDTSAA